MPIAEGRTIPFTGPEAVEVSVLETFEYAGPEQEIVTETREFSPVCPYSGLPDFATLRITYVPTDRCLELKSLKYYLTSYRNVGIFQEHATAKIAEDLFRVLQPVRLTVADLGPAGLLDPAAVFRQYGQSNLLVRFARLSAGNLVTFAQAGGRIPAGITRLPLPAGLTRSRNHSALFLMVKQGSVVTRITLPAAP